MECFRPAAGMVSLTLALLLCPPQTQATPRFTVATFNTENYLLKPIDTRPAKSDPGRAQVRKTLLTLNADILALQEIGGWPALEELQSTLSKQGLHYPHLELVTGADTHIQLAVLSRFPFSQRSPQTNDHFLLFGHRHRVSRGFAEVTVQITPRYSVTLLNAHLKSRRQVGYADQAELREAEAAILRKRIDTLLAAQRDANIIVVGDLNDSRDSRPVRTLIGRGNNALIDTRPAEPNGDNQPNPNPRYDPRRITWTHHYGLEDSYSRFDYILISRGLAREWIEPQTYILALPNWGTASDHRPLLAAFHAEDR